jgi:hypothetical protein
MEYTTTIIGQPGFLSRAHGEQAATHADQINADLLAFLTDQRMGLGA